jgi:hypothetical protein
MLRSPGKACATTKRRGLAADLLQVQQGAITDAIQDCS